MFLLYQAGARLSHCDTDFEGLDWKMRRWKGVRVSAGVQSGQDEAEETTGHTGNLLGWG